MTYAPTKEAQGGLWRVELSEEQGFPDPTYKWLSSSPHTRFVKIIAHTRTDLGAFLKPGMKVLLGGHLAGYKDTQCTDGRGAWWGCPGEFHVDEAEFVINA